MEKAQHTRRPDRMVLSLQALYFLGTGVWPLAHIRSFTAVTGPKTDLWLVKTFGGLVAAVGAWMLWAMAGRRREAETAVLGASTGAVLAAAEVYYVSKRRISPVYLLDAALEVVVCAYWLGRVMRGAPGGHQSEARRNAARGPTDRAPARGL